MPGATNPNPAAPPAAPPSPPPAAPPASGPATADPKPAGRGSFSDILRRNKPATAPLSIPQQPPPGQLPTPPVAPQPEPPAGVRGAAPEDQPEAPEQDDPPEAPVVGSGGKQLSQVALSERVQRERNKVFRELYGTTDPAKVRDLRERERQQLAEYQALKAAEDERQRAAMSREEQLQADIAAANARAEAAENRLRELETNNVVQSQTEELRGIAGKHIKPSMLRYALIDFQAHVRSLTPEQLKTFTPRAVERWFSKHAEANPDLKLVGAPPAPPAAAPPPAPKPPVRRPLISSANPKGGTGTPPPKLPAPGTHAGKTVRPGLPNSMDQKELNAHLKSKGMRGWR